MNGESNPSRSYEVLEWQHQTVKDLKKDKSFWKKQGMEDLLLYKECINESKADLEEELGYARLAPKAKRKAGLIAQLEWSVMAQDIWCIMIQECVDKKAAEEEAAAATKAAKAAAKSIAAAAVNLVAQNAVDAAAAAAATAAAATAAAPAAAEESTAALPEYDVDGSPNNVTAILADQPDDGCAMETDNDDLESNQLPEAADNLAALHFTTSEVNQLLTMAKQVRPGSGEQKELWESFMKGFLVASGAKLEIEFTVEVSKGGAEGCTPKAATTTTSVSEPEAPGTSNIGVNPADPKGESDGEKQNPEELASKLGPVVAGMAALVHNMGFRGPNTTGRDQAIDDAQLFAVLEGLFATLQGKENSSRHVCSMCLVNSGHNTEHCMVPGPPQLTGRAKPITGDSTLPLRRAHVPSLKLESLDPSVENSVARMFLVAAGTYCDMAGANVAKQRLFRLADLVHDTYKERGAQPAELAAFKAMIKRIQKCKFDASLVGAQRAAFLAATVVPKPSQAPKRQGQPLPPGRANKLQACPTARQGQSNPVPQHVQTLTSGLRVERLPSAEVTPPTRVGKPAWLQNYSSVTGAAPLPGPRVVATIPQLSVPPPPPGPKPQGAAPPPLQEVVAYLAVPPPPPGPKPQVAETRFGPPVAIPQMGPITMMNQPVFPTGGMMGAPPQPFPPPLPPARGPPAGPSAGPSSMVVMPPLLGPQPEIAEEQLVIVTPGGPFPVDTYVPQPEFQPDGSIRIPSKLELAQRAWPGCFIQDAKTYYGIRTPKRSFH